MAVIDEYFDPVRDQRTEDVDHRLAIAISWRDYDVELRRQMLSAIAWAADEVFPPGAEANVRGASYHVGPMAQGPIVQMLFTAYEDIRPIANDLAAWIAIGGFGSLLIHRVREVLRRHISNTGATDSANTGLYLSDEGIVLSQPLIQGLCIQHFVNTHGRSSSRINISVTVRSPYPGIVWAGRPDASLIYTVRIWTGQVNYVYVIDGHGKPLEHFKTRGGEFTSLALPQWYDEKPYYQVGAATDGGCMNLDSRD